VNVCVCLCVTWYSVAPSKYQLSFVSAVHLASVDGIRSYTKICGVAFLSFSAAESREEYAAGVRVSLTPRRLVRATLILTLPEKPSLLDSDFSGLLRYRCLQLVALTRRTR
jgi:hypothetical protein